MTGIDFRLCPGLSAIAPEETDVIVIAGMGGETIIAILQDGPVDKGRPPHAAAPAHDKGR